MIYWRQKVLLRLLGEAPDRVLSKIQLIKWLFLLKEEGKIDQDGSFYNFLPYKYGPFSFLAYRDIAELERFGWIKEQGNSLQYNISENEIPKLSLSSSVIKSIMDIISNYGGISPQSLVKYIYEKYPWYASKSEINESKLQISIPKAILAVYSIGYEGLSIDSFLDIILKSGIQTIIDSRNNPISRKYGFSGITLKDKCKDIGLNYCPVPQVGISSKIRDQIHDKNMLWSLYINEILPQASESLKLIADMCIKEPAVLFCYEKNPEDCHRHIVAKEISMMTRLPVIHYRSKEEKWEKE